MFVHAVLDKQISAYKAGQMAQSVKLVEPIHDTVYKLSIRNEPWSDAMHLAEAHLRGDFAVFGDHFYKDGSFFMGLAYRTSKNGTIESIKIHTTLNEKTGQWRLVSDIHCITTRKEFHERIKPILDLFEIHPKKYQVLNLDAPPDSGPKHKRDNIMPWWMDNSGFAIALARMEIDDVSTTEQFEYALEFIHEAAGAELEARFDESAYPKWVKEFKEALKSEAVSTNVSAGRCKLLVDFWDKLTDMSKAMIPGNMNQN